MKTTRRDFLTGTTAGLAAGLVIPSIGLAGAQRRGGGAGQGEGRGLPAMPWRMPHRPRRPNDPEATRT